MNSKPRFLYLGLLLLISCNNELKFEELKMFERQERGVHNRYWIVYDYKDTKSAEAQIDQHACDVIENLSDDERRYSFSYYKKSPITNLKKLQENPEMFWGPSLFEDGSFPTDYIYSIFIDLENNEARKHKPKSTLKSNFFFETIGCFNN